MYKSIVLSALALAIVSCATRPESISAIHVSHERYIDNTCTELATKISDARADLAKVSELQNSKANGDAWGVFLLFVPVSQMSGDHEADVAKAKGVIEAIETAQIKNKCKSS